MATLVAEIAVQQIGYYSVVAREDGQVDLVSDFKEGQPQVSGLFKNGLEAVKYLITALKCEERALSVSLYTDEETISAWKRTDNLFRLWYAGEFVCYQGFRDARPTVGTVSLQGEVSLEKTADVRWDGSADSLGYSYAQKAAERCVAEGLATGYHQEGASGYDFKNSIVLDGVRGRKVQAIKLDSYTPMLPSQIEFVAVTVADGSEEQVRTRAEEIRLEEREKEAVREWDSIVQRMGTFDTVGVERFNQLLASDYEPPTGFAIAHKYTTGRGNDTIIVVRVGTTIRCPSSQIARLLIGKGGENIKEFSRKHFGGKRINVIS